MTPPSGRDTRAWLDTMVIGMNLCPFARAALPGTKIIVASDVTDARSLREVIARELAVLAAAPTTQPATTLVVLPPAVTDRLGATTHEGFMEGAYRARRTRRAADGVDGGRRRRRRRRRRGKGGRGRRSTSSRFIRWPRSAAACQRRTRKSRAGTHAPTDVPDDDEDEEDDEEEDDGAKGGKSDGVRSPPTTEELRRMIEAHESFAGGADRRADWRAVTAVTSESDAGPAHAGHARDGDPRGAPPVDPADFTGRSPHPRAAPAQAVRRIGRG